jgi:hypothetical protein
MEFFAVGKVRNDTYSLIANETISACLPSTMNKGGECSTHLPHNVVTSRTQHNDKRILQCRHTQIRQGEFHPLIVRRQIPNNGPGLFLYRCIGIQK